MFPAGDDKPGVMDSSQATVSYIRQAAMVGRVVQRDALLSQRWSTAVPENHQDHSLLPNPLWAKAVHLIS